MPASGLIVPVVLWGKEAPTHCISCVYLSKDQRTLITGAYDGQICLWQVEPDTLKMTPRCLLVGHSAPILCLSKASISAENNFIVSSSESGEMATWDLVDGKCCELAKLPYVHTNIQPYHMSGTEDDRLFCNGYYAEILIIDPFSLEVLFSLASRVNPDWISALHVLRPAKRKDDVVLGLTTTGMIKMWPLPAGVGKGSDPLYETESKQIRCLNALGMSCCAYNQRTVLIVCAKFWQIYDAGDFSVLCSVSPPRGERWLGGEFLAADRVLLWSDEGRGYMYRLPSNKLRGKFADSCIAESKDFHNKAIDGDNPFLYCTLAMPVEKPLSCPPAMRFFQAVSQQGKPTCKYQKLLIRGDSEGAIKFWDVPDVSNNQLAQIKQEDFNKPPALPPTHHITISEVWSDMKPAPAGIVDQLETPSAPSIHLTASIYLPQQGRLVCGREDGSIIIVPASQTVMLQLLHGKHQQYDDWPPHQVLLGHAGRVNCLLYPNHVHPRYEVSHLVSGGVDFAVCLWDLYSGSLLHRFCVHAGEITQLMVPPNNCSPRVLKCICSVASDHSVAILGLSERKCVVLASRHLFPVVTVKWRPLDDFMVVGCSDGTVYIWQMETGHLDRVLHGICGEEVLHACDENVAATSSASAGGDMGLANPAVHFFRGLRSRNLSAIRHATQRGLHQLQQLHHHSNHHDGVVVKSDAPPLVIQGYRTNPKDSESHILFFDIEALIVQLLSEEYSAMSPGTLEAQGLINSAEYEKVAALTQSASPDAHKKIVDFFGRVKDKAGDMERILKEKDKHGILAKVKEGAETMHTRLQAKAESVGLKNVGSDGRERKGSDGESRGRGSRAGLMETVNITMEVAQLLLSLIHAWGLDPDLDKVCEGKLGLLRPMVPVSFGIMSKGGFMCLQLPTWQSQLPAVNPASTSSGIEANLPPEMVRMEMATRLFTARTHWELSTVMTTTHLLSIIAIANTLMSMNCATFIPEQERRRKMHRPGLRQLSIASEDVGVEEDAFTAQQAQIKQGWSLLSTLHCILLPDKLSAQGSKIYKRPLVELLARRWQDQCLEVRSASQTLLLAELTRMGSKGRKALVDSWAPFLPFKPDKPGPTNQPQTGAQHPQPEGNGEGEQNQQHHQEDAEEDDDEHLDELAPQRPSTSTEAKRKEATAVVLLGVIGAEFGQDIETSATKRKASEGGEQPKKRGSVVEGFGIGAAGSNLARCTSLALMNLLLSPPSSRLPTHSSMRRAAMDLLGRGFTVWEPYLDVSKVLLGLLEQCCESDHLVPSMAYGLPLTPTADACRTARHSLSLIATARPAAFITTMAREVARYNTLQQNAQTININLSQTVLHRAKPEILRNIELLIDKMQSEMADLLVEVMDIVLHCVDPGHLKVKTLNEVFPAVCRFHQVSHCTQTRRIAVGAKSGQLAIYELRSNRCQLIAAHGAPIAASSFSPDGKFLASYSCTENKICFWQTSTGMFGLGNSQTRCVKTYPTQPIADLSRHSPMKLGRLIWITNKTVSLMLCDGSEARYNV
ncbi:WD repeat-containing protein 7 isoform X1 [Neocloeon triangulifer]|uniref:WD repeat-containing protein 7 isoform X1 n=1 Tax=Neocloeon triangulifer TaxID=2078957 RepID=UPI00286EFF6D|nr:WD repeat-containing protein 7 isoform X1 [Neocloeon triangulifer]XP_059484213.1 WD repeat-containing protein 7 isoform X1 [Neocloeon triangulifer]XP_059484223.1 WD repeat-containing protein 7 isoform X1 [Neocloeon triangulifer]XP_059484231.1 WD repeat-containing protein 7 isoform X1 [Neocloeon triangulifer]